MINLLNELEAELRRAAPDVAAKLRPGLEPQRIDAMLEHLPQPAPDDVRTLYTWHDGTDYAYGAYRAEVYRGGMFLPLQEALDDRTGGLDSGSGWDRRWLPVFMDEHFLFDAVVFGPDGGALVNFSYLDLPYFDVDYPSLADFVQSLITRWRTGVYWTNATGDVTVDPRALAALRRQEDGGEPDPTPLVNALRLDDGWEWSAAVSRLRSRLYPTAVPALIALLGEPSNRSRFYAVELLGSIGDRSALPALQRVVREDPDENVRKYAEKTIREWS